MSIPSTRYKVIARLSRTVPRSLLQRAQGMGRR
jgi:hypothetical protein